MHTRGQNALRDLFMYNCRSLYTHIPRIDWGRKLIFSPLSTTPVVVGRPYPKSHFRGVAFNTNGPSVYFGWFFFHAEVIPTECQKSRDCLNKTNLTTRWKKMYYNIIWSYHKTDKHATRVRVQAIFEPFYYVRFSFPFDGNNYKTITRVYDQSWNVDYARSNVE